MVNIWETIPKDDENIILNDVWDQENHSIRTNATIGDIEIDSLSDSISIGDSVTGNQAEVIDRKLQVGGNFAIPPPTDFRTKTYTVTNTPVAITFAGFVITALALKALGENRGYIRIGKSNVLVGDYYLLSPGESLNLPLTASTEPVFFVLDPAAPAGTYILTITAVN